MTSRKIPTDTAQKATRRPQVHFTMTAKSMLEDLNKLDVVETLVTESGLGKGAMVLIRSTARKTSNNPARHFTVQVQCASDKSILVPDLIASLKKDTGAKFVPYIDPAAAPDVPVFNRRLTRD